jgi:hypothetical protein
MNSINFMDDNENLKMLNELMGLQKGNILEELGGINGLTTILKNSNEEEKNNIDNISNEKTNNNLLEKIKDVWSNDYYDNENLDDFLISDNKDDEDEE